MPIDLDTLKVDFQINANPEDKLNIEDRICSSYDLNPNNVRISNSALKILKELINFFNEKITIPVPDYFEFPSFCKEYELIQRKEDFSIPKIGKKSKVILVSNPNNPTGTAHNLDRLIQQTKRNNQYLIVDEAYSEFCNNRYSVMNRIKDNNHVIAIRTMSKFYGMTNDKLAYVAGPAEILNNLQLPEATDSAKSRASDLLSINDLSQYINRIYQQKMMLNRILCTYDCESINGVTNFIMVRNRKRNLSHLMHKINVKVVDLNQTPGIENQKYIRIAVSNYRNISELSRRLQNENL